MSLWVRLPFLPSSSLRRLWPFIHFTVSMPFLLLADLRSSLSPSSTTVPSNLRLRRLGSELLRRHRHLQRLRFVLLHQAYGTLHRPPRLPHRLRSHLRRFSVDPGDQDLGRSMGELRFPPSLLPLGSLGSRSWEEGGTSESLTRRDIRG